MILHLLWIIALLPGTLLGWGGPLSQAAPPEPLRVEGPAIDNAFPDHFTVTFHIQSPGDPIRLVRGKVQYGNRPIREVIQFNFTPAEETDATWTWNTHRQTVAPYIPLTLWLEIRTTAGLHTTLGPYHLAYEDNRFQWKEERGKLLILRWYKGDEDFGRALYAIGQRALKRQLHDFGITLQTPFVVLVYASEKDFFAWHAIRTEWVGGQAFPSLGAAAVIIPPDELDWAKEVIPHELLHLTLRRVIHNPFGEPPAWFEEGLAQYYEESDHSYISRYLDKAIAENRVLPLGIMRDPPGQNVETAYIWYAQALSMVQWLLESRGTTALQQYIALMQKPIAPRRAFRQAFGLSEETFYASWCEHVHVNCPLATPTQTPLPTATSTPTPWPTRPPTPTHLPTFTPSPAPSSSTSTPPPSPQPSTPPPPSWGWLLIFALVFIVTLGIIIGTIWRA